MYKSLIENADKQQLAIFSMDLIKMLSTDSELLGRAKNLLYRSIHGDHFCEESLEEALKLLENDDGSHGAHWTVDETTKVAQQYGIPFDIMNKYDWNYVMNMMFSDYSGIFGDDAHAIAKLANKFVFDKDAPKGKPYKYYMAMH